MLPGFQYHGGTAPEHGGGIGLRFGTRQSARNTSVRQRLGKEIGKGGTATGQRSGCVDQLLRQLVNKPRPRHQGTEFCCILRRHVRVGGAQDDTLPDGAGRVGHDAQDRSVRAEQLLQPRKTDSCQHGYQHRAGGDGRRNLCRQLSDHARLDAQEQEPAGGGKGGIAVARRTAQPCGGGAGMLRRVAGDRDAVGGYCAQRRLRQCAPHVSGADEACGKC